MFNVKQKQKQNQNKASQMSSLSKKSKAIC